MENTNLNREQILAVIKRVAENHKRKTFDIHDEEDISQQVHQIALIALPKYHYTKSKNKDPEKAFESWLNALISNRLTNFYRDRFGVKHKPRKKDTEFDKQKRVNLHHPIDLSSMDIPDPLNHHEDEEFFEYLLKEMDMTFIELMFSCMSGENVGSYYRYRLQSKIMELRNKWRQNQN